MVAPTCACAVWGQRLSVAAFLLQLHEYIREGIGMHVSSAVGLCTPSCGVATRRPYFVCFIRCFFRVILGLTGIQSDPPMQMSSTPNWACAVWGQS